MRLSLLFGCILIGAVPSSAQSEKLLEQKEKALVRLNGNGTDAALRQQLLGMGKLDQHVRKPLETMFTKTAKPTSESISAVNRTIEQTDQKLTEQLKRIVAKNGWPTIHLVGAEASSAAAIILVHSPDHDFQRGLLPQLDILVSDGKIIGADIAILIDKFLQADGKLQRFGTVFQVSNGEAVLDPIEDPAHVDELRAKYMLPSIGDFKKSFAKAFHVTTQ